MGVEPIVCFGFFRFRCELHVGLLYPVLLGLDPILSTEKQGLTKTRRKLKLVNIYDFAFFYFSFFSIMKISFKHGQIDSSILKYQLMYHFKKYRYPFLCVNNFHRVYNDALEVMSLDRGENLR